MMPSPPTPGPRSSRSRVHAIGVTAGTIAAIALVAVALAHLPTTAATAIVIYALGMLAVFCFSAAYNLSRSPRRWLLRRCDHAAIFIKIAATYTPFAAVKMGGTIGFALLGAVWGHRARRRRRQASRPAVLRAHVVRAVPGAGVDVLCSPWSRCSACCRRQRCCCCSSAACSTRWAWCFTCRSGCPSQRDLARLCADGVGLPLRCCARRRGAELAAPRLGPGPA